MVEIIIRNNRYFLRGENIGIRCEIDCIQRLESYNNPHQFVATDCELYNLFSQDNEENIENGIRLLNRAYHLQRRPVFNPLTFAPILITHLDEIRDTQEANLGTLETICANFNAFRNNLPNNPLPEVSLSKLLHFINPTSFWILDSRVNFILQIWGYGGSYRGFGNFLRDILNDPNFNSFREFVFEKDVELVNNHHIENYQPYLLKVLDKIIWFH